MMGRYRYFAGTLTIGTMVAFYTYITRIFDPIATAMELYSRSQRMMVCARRVLEVMNTELSNRDGEGVEWIVVAHVVEVDGRRDSHTHLLAVPNFEHLFDCFFEKACSI